MIPLCSSSYSFAFLLFWDYLECTWSSNSDISLFPKAEKKPHKSTQQMHDFFFQGIHILKDYWLLKSYRQLKQPCRNIFSLLHLMYQMLCFVSRTVRSFRFATRLCIDFYSCVSTVALQLALPGVKRDDETLNMRHEITYFTFWI